MSSGEEAHNQANDRSRHKAASIFSLASQPTTFHLHVLNNTHTIMDDDDEFGADPDFLAALAASDNPPTTPTPRITQPTPQRLDPRPP
ncbi:hypothetical protein V500_09720, partial [Pseudogymnoascus sp. VKM F-4518 (FW-2643)]